MADSLTADRAREIADEVLGPTEPQGAPLDVVMGVDPDQAARVHGVARQAGLPPQAVESDVDAFERSVKARAVDTSQWGPSLRTLMADPYKSRIAHDDLDNLLETERVLKTGSVAWQLDRAGKSLKDIGNAALSGVYQLSSGLLGVLENAADLTMMPDEVTDFIEAKRKEGQALVAHHTPRPESQAVRDIYSGISSGTSNLITLSLGLLTRNPTWALGTMAGMSGGLSASKAKDQGMSPVGSFVHGATNGLIEYGTEMMPAFKLIEDFGLDTPFAKMIANQLVTEIPGEQVATILQDFTDWAFLPENANATMGEYLAERPSAALSTLISTVVGTGMQTGAIYGIGRLTRETPDEVDAEIVDTIRNQLAQDQLDQMITLAQSSKLGGRAQDVYQEFLRGAGSEMQVFVPADIVTQLYGDAGLPVPPEFAEQIDGSGADVAIDAETFMSGLARDEAAMEVLRPHLKLGEDLLSAREIEQGDDSAVRRMLERANAAQETKAEADQIWETVKDQLIGAGVRDDVANASAALYPAYATVAAQDFGITPQEVFESMGFKVQRAPEGGALETDEVLAQAAADAGLSTEEFKRWWLESKVVDEKGAPLRVFHGTEKAGFTVFDTDGEGKTEGTGAFFTNTSMNAFTYSGTQSEFVPVSPEEVASDPGSYGIDVTEEDGRFYTLSPRGYEYSGDTLIEALEEMAEQGELFEPQRGNYEVYLSIQNPMVIDAQGDNWDSIGSVWVVTDDDGDIMEGFIDEDEAREFAGKYEEETGVAPDVYFDEFSGETTDQLARDARENGYDGLIIENVTDEGPHGQGYGWGDKVFVVFSPNQVKSVYNRGTFDPNDPDILRQPPIITDFANAQIEEQVSVAETGETVTITEPVERRYTQLSKRRDTVAKLLECVR